MLNTDTLPDVLNVYRRLVQLGDSSFQISVVGHDEHWADDKTERAIEEINRVLKLLSLTDENSQIARINNAAGLHPVKVGQELFHLITRSLKVSDITQGAFDISHNMAEDYLADAVNPADNYRNIILDTKNSTVFLRKKGMGISMGSITNGYAVDRAKYVLRMQGVSSGVINAFGNLVTWGRQPNDKPWTIEAASPELKLKAFAGLNISDMALSTSGIDHLLVDGASNYLPSGVHPKTGLPLPGIKSVSVMSPSAELAAAMSAPVMLMGVKVSLKMFNRLNQLVCVIVNKRKKVYTSKSINLMMC